jgi:hypothetical protein
MIASHIRANVVGYVALFLALGGVSYAAGLAPNSVKSKHIKNGQYRRPTSVQEPSTPRRSPATRLAAVRSTNRALTRRSYNAE